MIMGYTEQNLMPGEQIVYKAKLHWAMFLGPIVNIILAILIFLIGISSRDSSTSVMTCLAGIIFLSAILNSLNAVVSYVTTEFALTNKRVIAKTGLLRRRSVELLLTKIESIGVNQPILGRMLDYGTITVTGTGGTKEPFKNIAAPMELRKCVNTQIAGE